MRNWKHISQIENSKAALENSLVVTQKVNHGVIIWLRNSALGIYPRKWNVNIFSISNIFDTYMNITHLHTHMWNMSTQKFSPECSKKMYS